MVARTRNNVERISGFLRRLVASIDDTAAVRIGHEENNALVIFDQVQSGPGGKAGMFDHANARRARGISRRAANGARPNDEYGDHTDRQAQQ